MKPREIFDIVVRTAGLIVLLYGLGHLMYGLCGALDLLGENKYGRYNALTGVVEVIAGLMIMRGVVPLTDMAFPPETSQGEDSEAEPTPDKGKDESRLA